MILYILTYVIGNLLACRSQWTRGLRRGCHSHAGIVGSNPAGGHGCLSLVSVVFCQVEVSASGWSLVHSTPTEYGVSECDHESSIIRRPWPTSCCAMEKRKSLGLHTHS